MAMLFGIQLLSTLIIGLFMSKIFSNYSYSLLIFYNLWFCVPPVAEYLGTFSQAYKDHLKKKPKSGEKKVPLDEFTIPKDSELKIRSNRIISPTQLSLLPHSDDIDIIVLLTISSILIYIVTELSLHFNFTPVSDLHLSYIWSMIVIGYCVKFLGYMVKIYLQLGGGERSLCALSTFIFLVAALFVSMADKSIIDFGIEEGYNDFVKEFVHFANATGVKQGQDLTMPSVKAFKGFLVVVSGLIATLLAFPSFRLGCLNNRLLRASDKELTRDEENVDSSSYTLLDRAKLLLVHFNLLAPLLVCLCWCKPLVREHIKSQVDISDNMFDLLRIVFIMTIMLVRVASVKLYAQTHLNMALSFLNNLKREAGRIDHKTVQTKIAYTFQYGGIMVMQILTPCIIVLQLCFILLSLQNMPDEIPVPVEAPSVLPGLLSDVLPLAEPSGIRAVFTKTFLMSITNYFVWWIGTVTTGVSLFSTGYYHLSDV